jgi:hypothetical protein
VCAGAGERLATELDADRPRAAACEMADERAVAAADVDRDRRAVGQQLVEDVAGRAGRGHGGA